MDSCKVSECLEDYAEVTIQVDGDKAPASTEVEPNEAPAVKSKLKRSLRDLAAISDTSEVRKPSKNQKKR